MVLVLALLLCAAATVSAQTPPVQQRLFDPATMTNRQLGFFGDASAVGWNPSLLGTRKTLDLVAATSLNDQFALSGQYGVFVRMLGFAAGYVANTGSFATGELYAGLGLNIIDDVLWIGASGRVVNPGELRNVDWSATRYNASLLVKPIIGLYLTGGANTMGLDTWLNEAIQGSLNFNHVRSAPDSLVAYAGATYSPLNWVSLFVHYTTPPLLVRGAAPAIQSTNFGLDVGASVTLFNDVLILSGNYNVPAQTVRVGAEANIGALGVLVPHYAAKRHSTTRCHCAVFQRPSPQHLGTAWRTHRRRRLPCAC